MANLNEVLKDPDFWGAETTDDDRKWALSQVDKTFASKPPQEQDQILQNFSKTRQKSQERESAERNSRAQVYEPKIAEQQAKFQQFVAPLTETVGRGVEAATIPLVGVARMAQGESPTQAFGPETFTTVGAGGKAQDTRTRVASNIVPQSPWQAGAMGAQFIPGVGGLGTAGRVAASAAAAGGLQGLLGGKGLVEGGSLPEAGMEALAGAAKGGATQLGGELLGKAAGAAARHTPGLGKAVNNAEARRVAKGAAELAPEYSNAGRTSGDIGSFFKMSEAHPTGGAKEAASQAFRDKISELEAQLVDTRGHPYIQAPELVAAYRAIVKQYGKDPVLQPQIKALAPTNGGFLPEQAARIISLTTQRLSTGEGAALHMKDQAADDLVRAIEKSLPTTAQGILPAARGAYSKASAIQELLGAAFKPSNKGYQIDMPRVQAMISEDPEMARRLTKEGFGELVQVLTRGVSKKPGFADQPAGNWNFVPVSSTGVKATLLKHLLQRYKYVGEKPLTVPAGGKAGLGVATSAYAGSSNKKEE